MIFKTLFEFEGEDITVSPDEFFKLKTYGDLHEKDEWAWYNFAKDLLGERCPPPYSGSHKIIVDWSKK
jgi:hypothetical protein